MIVGPFLRPKPSTSATHIEMVWCYIWLNERGQIVAIEWLI